MKNESEFTGLIKAAAPLPIVRRTLTNCRKSGAIHRRNFSKGEGWIGFPCARVCDRAELTFWRCIATAQSNSGRGNRPPGGRIVVPISVAHCFAPIQPLK